MRMIGLLAIGLVVAISFGCATSDMADDPKSMEPNMTADLGLGDSADSILSKYGKPLYKSLFTKHEDLSYTRRYIQFLEGIAWDMERTSATRNG